MQITIDIPDELYETIKSDEYGVHQGRIYDIIRNGTPLSKGHESLEEIELPKNATNGDVIKAKFPNYHIQIGPGQVCLYYPVTEAYSGSWIRFDEEWWKAPYKAESEDKV